jgi:hypothetical protein
MTDVTLGHRFGEIDQRDKETGPRRNAERGPVVRMARPDRVHIGSRPMNPRTGSQERRSDQPRRRFSAEGRRRGELLGVAGHLHAGPETAG